MAQSATAPSAAISLGGGYFLAALGSLLFATKAIFIKLAYGTAAVPAVDAITLLALRMGFSLPVYLVIGTLAWRERVSRGLAPPDARQIAGAILVGMLGYYVASYLDFEGLVYITAQLERLILFTYPFFVMLLGALFFDKRVTLWGVASLLVAYIGIASIFVEGATATGDHTAWGSLLVLGAAFSFALYQLIAKPLMTAMGSRVFTCIAMSGACLAVLGHYIFVSSPVALLDLPAQIVMLSGMIAIFATILPSFMLNAALDRIGSEAVSVIGTLSPTATIVMAIAFLGEPFGWADALGTTLVMAGVGLFTWRDSRKI
jgi:drug/metabolite transporter (DMT)-like permease